MKRCIEEIKIQAENIEKIYSVYVVDQQDRLKGRICLKRILLAEDDKKVAEIFEETLFLWVHFLMDKR